MWQEKEKEKCRSRYKTSKKKVAFELFMLVGEQHL